VSNEQNIEFLILIAERKKKEDFLTVLTRAGARVINTVYGKGSAKVNSVMEALGIIPDDDKIVITCLISEKNSDTVFEILVKEFNFDKPNTGIAFTVPVEGLSY
jgi:hypothetical protein